MDIETYNKREQKLVLREKLLSIEEARLVGVKSYSVDELDIYLSDIIKGASDEI